ncbi:MULTISPECIES: tRNA (adenosine(37)-N6)-threonylcarbamoyltransferase complex ATPase subunit type 1 TsaE [unclassified Corallococcus]|uniref:tRNA (adenosine(37)-N6)-threonylcarbamoyltransferase complex ATPase subunit type 1 TsaE n=1 Tax=unclassified Corallococcus TaxID=2685029 RepID=UPI001A906437|nr:MULTISPECIES: tRNA (adenosine(37)-N6)-threonylcarbamoyltransferase complex ATPase subunit type 1 TsaE [unclassified Corallococcus]MBN9685754.1 tRNA (adenosine(37)-N6)-threonylcarbamoyltransferase complex ATPase subunit type 1 TsaE [Corallococcus sp. NCSPR001]WAS82802.1 tRNA (adenosine(37)-N6)-threonylcarbamoyltransferase complex ATPase subunit type 1 TsaE [Corallococcus sp. NCRR]
MSGAEQPTRSRRLVSPSPEETHRLGVKLGQLLQPGDFVGLIGDLGAGKTHLVRGVAAGAGVAESEVASPTFAIVYPYAGRIPLYHADLYRLTDYDELYATGFLDLVGGDHAMLVEWLDRIPQAAPRDFLRVTLRHAGEDARSLDVEAFGARPAALLEAWLG